MKKFVMRLCWLALILVWLHPAESWADITVTDMVGRQVTITKPPDRIICLAPGALRLIVYLQAQDKVVGVEDLEKKYPDLRPYWMAHPELAERPSVGPGGTNAINGKPDLEKILAAAPDVIFITYMEKALADQVQQDIGLPVVVLTYGPFASFDDRVFDSLRVAGRILDRDARAEAVIGFIQNEAKALG